LKILVTVKRIPDPEENLEFAGGTIDVSSAKWVPNTFDEYAMETALRLAEHIGGSERLAEVVVLSICPQDQRQHVTQFLAMGADRAIVVDATDHELDTVTVSKTLAAVFQRENCDLLLVGKLSQDNEGNQVGQRVAALLGLPQATFAATVAWDRTAKTVTVGREVDDGVETKQIPLPAVVTVDLRVVLPHSVNNGATPNDHAYQSGPRLASLRGITLAKKKPVLVLSPQELGISVTSTEQPAGTTAPPQRKAGQRVASVEELIEKLAKEAKVL